MAPAWPGVVGIGDVPLEAAADERFRVGFGGPADLAVDVVGEAVELRQYFATNTSGSAWKYGPRRREFADVRPPGPARWGRVAVRNPQGDPHARPHLAPVRGE